MVQYQFVSILEDGKLVKSLRKTFLGHYFEIKMLRIWVFDHSEKSGKNWDICSELGS